MADISFDDLVPKSAATGGAAPAGGVAFDDLIPGADKSPGVVVPTLKRTAGQLVESAGRVVEDLGQGAGSAVAARLGGAARAYGQDVMDRNPAEVNSLGEFLEKPWTGVKESVAQMGAQVPVYLAGLGAGRVLGGLAGGALAGPPGAAVGATLGGYLGGLGAAALPEYGEIRSKQDETGAVDIPMAAGGALAAGAVENLGGVQKLIRKGVADAGLTGSGVKARLLHAGKAAVKSGLEEGAEELVQSPIEQYSGGQDPTTPESLAETAFGGVMGFVGGAPFGGVHGAVARRGPEPVPAGPLETAARVAEGSGATAAAQAARAEAADSAEGTPTPTLPRSTGEGAEAAPAEAPDAYAKTQANRALQGKALRKKEAEAAAAYLTRFNGGEEFVVIAHPEKKKFFGVARRSDLEELQDVPDRPPEATPPELPAEPSAEEWQGALTAARQWWDGAPEKQRVAALGRLGAEGEHSGKTFDELPQAMQGEMAGRIWESNHVQGQRDRADAVRRQPGGTEPVPPAGEASGLEAAQGGVAAPGAVPDETAVSPVPQGPEQRTEVQRPVDQPAPVERPGPQGYEAQPGHGPVGAGAVQSMEPAAAGGAAQPVGRVSDSVTRQPEGSGAEAAGYGGVPPNPPYGTGKAEAPPPSAVPPNPPQANPVPSGNDQEAPHVRPQDATPAPAPVVSGAGDVLPSATAHPGRAPAGGGDQGGGPSVGTVVEPGAETGTAGAGPGEPAVVEPAAAVVEASPVDQQAHAAATSPANGLAEPSEARKEAGNYAKGHARIGGLDISIENPAGSTRSGADQSGKPWSVTMRSHYGYVRGSVGKDKDHVDVFVKPGTPEDYAGPVYVVDQRDPRTKRFDEHKAMIGFASRDAAEAGYRENYAADWKGAGQVTEMPWERFKAWVKDPEQTKRPAAKTPATNEADDAALGRIWSGGGEGLTRMGRLKVARRARFSEKGAERLSKMPWHNLSANEKARLAGMGDLANALAWVDKGGKSAEPLVPETPSPPSTVMPGGNAAEASPPPPPEHRAENSSPPAGEEQATASEEPSPQPSPARGRGSEKEAAPADLDQGGANEPNNAPEIGARDADKADSEPKAGEAHPAEWGANNVLVSRERAAELRERLKKKLGQLNSGVDPEMLAIGVELAAFHIEAGARRFGDFARAIAKDLGVPVVSLRPYLRAWYNGARDMIEDHGLSVEGTDDAEAVKGEVKRLFEPAKATSDKGSDKGSDKTIGEPPPQPSLGVPGERAKEPVRVLADDLAGGRRFASIVEARKRVAELTGETIEPGTVEAKRADEMIEAAGVLAARKIVAEGRPEGETFDRLADLSDRLPGLNTRTSTSVEQQAYSTPLPIAYVASRRAGITARASVLEPTAGNGALLIEASPNTTAANELNPERAAALREQGFQVQEADASEAAFELLNGGKGVDVVITNPPFGVVKGADGESRRFRLGPNYVTTEIDHAIALNALKAMSDDGRAVLIVGGPAKTLSDKGRSDAYNGKAKRAFFYTLYNEYNVTDHFTVSGDLYRKQGAAWPVDVIVIEGRGKSARALPAVDLPRIIHDLEELKRELPTERSESNRSENRRAGADAVASGTEPSGSEGADATVGEPAGRGGAGARPADGDGAGVRGGAGNGAAATGPERDPLADEPATELPVGGGAGVGFDSEFGPVEAKAEKPAVTSSFQATYQPASAARSVGTLVPVNMRDAVARALGRVVERHGPVDAYVAKELGYAEQDLPNYFSAEQVDALALALDNLARGKGFIIGDQTGVGKGRFVAGIIRYAMRNGMAPIFVTEKPNLYGDMLRDLNDIGMPDVRPVVTNAGFAIPMDDDANAWYDAAEAAKARGEKPPAPFGKFLKTPAGGAHAAQLRQLMEARSLGEYDVIFTTYNQMQTVKGERTQRMDFLEQFAAGGVVIFDESHNAGGNEVRTFKREKQQGADDSTKTGRAYLARQLVKLAQGVVYSSATYAKRPEVMDLYSKTDMGMGFAKPSELSAALASGGVPLQQVVASMLAEAGQYIRREKSFDGISYETVSAAVDRRFAENAATIMRDIMRFDKLKKAAIAGLDKDLKADARKLSADRSTGGAGAVSTNFTSVMHNLIGQMLLTLKVQPTLDEALAALKRGEKPVIALANTMGSAIQEYADEVGLKPGDAIALNFGDLMKRYLQKSRRVIEGDAFGKKTSRELTDQELGPAAVKFYRETLKKIDRMGFGEVPVSPIDALRQGLAKEGYRVGEITGRTAIVDYSGAMPVFRRRKAEEVSTAGKRKTIQDFNSGKLDAVILNQSGATGLSLHASEKFQDRRPRRMLITQAELNIDTHMQMLGRVNRTGQVVLPSYGQLVADIPAEKRPASILAKKMAGLNANTTANRSSAVTAKDVPDFMNQYGDQVAAAVMYENDEWHEALGKPLNLNPEGDGYETEGAIRKVTGRIPVLPLKQQEEVYAAIEDAYSELIETLDRMGENDLEAKTFDLDAVTKAKTEAVPARGEKDSPFGGAVTAETVNVKFQGKPLTLDQVAQEIGRGIGFKMPKDAGLSAELGAARDKHYAALLDRTREDYRAYRETVEAAYPDADTDDKVRKVRDAELAKNDQRMAKVEALLTEFKPGQGVRYLSAGGPVYGVVGKVERKGKTKNPVALSDWKVTIYVAEPWRQFTTTLPRLNFQAQGQTLALERGLMSADPAEVRKAFEEGQATTREDRTILTGNLLAGFGDFRQGRILNFTRRGGEVAQGILMPRSFDLKEEQDARPVVFDEPGQVRAFAEALPIAWQLDSADGAVRLTGVGTRGLSLSVPKSKAEGGRYYLNQPLRDALGMDFVSAPGGVMAARNFGVDRLDRVLGVLYGMGVRLQAEGNNETARKVTGKAAAGGKDRGEEARYSTVSEDTLPALREAPSTEASLVAELARSGFARDIKKLMRAGLVTIQPSRQAPPGTPRTVSALWSLSRHTAILYHDRIPQGKAPGKVAHELTHGTLRPYLDAILGPEAYGRVTAEFERLLRDRNTWAEKAERRARWALDSRRREADLARRLYQLVPGEETRGEYRARLRRVILERKWLADERLAYMLEEYVNATEEQRRSLSGRVKLFFRELFAAVRMAFYRSPFYQAAQRAGIKMELTPADIAALVRAAVEWRVRQDSNTMPAAGIPEARYSDDGEEPPPQPSPAGAGEGVTPGDPNAAPRLERNLKAVLRTDPKGQGKGFLKSLRPLALQLLGRRQLVDLYQDDVPALRGYSDLVQAYGADANKIQTEADRLAQDWGRLAKKVADALADTMHFDTLHQVSGAWAQYRPKWDAESAAADFREELGAALKEKRRLDALIKSTGGNLSGHQIKEDYWRQWQDLGKQVERMSKPWAEKSRVKQRLAEERQRKADYAKSRARFLALPKEAQAIYTQAAGMYDAQWKAVEQALVERIERSDAAESEKRKIIDKLRLAFRKQLPEVYFPLHRAGDYVVVVKNADGTNEFVGFAESPNAAEALRREMLARYGKTDKQVMPVAKKKERSAQDMVSGRFVSEVLGLIGEAGGGPQTEALREQVMQLYLENLPDLSWAKHEIHRKKVPGYSADARRAFASHMFHGAAHLARIRYADRLEKALDLAQTQVDGRWRDTAWQEQHPEWDAVRAQEVVSEMRKRHDILMNPPNTPLANLLTSAGFVWFMGLSPASALVNLTQTPLVAFPVLGARFGFRKAWRALTAASTDAAKALGGGGWLKDEQAIMARLKAVLPADEYRAIEQGVNEGHITVTLAHDLAGVAQGANRNPRLEAAMKAASVMFHQAEMLNRISTVLAGYRMAKAAVDPEAGYDTAAYAKAIELNYESHFDYAAANRPRAMQAPLLRVVLQFKQYAQNMLWLMGKSAYEGLIADENFLPGADKAARRREAQRTLAGLMAMHALVAGAFGLPFVTTLLAAASWAGSDDDEPWDAEVALRNFLADVFGERVGEALVHGAPRLARDVLPIDVSSRVGLDHLLLPDVQEGLEGDKWYQAATVAALGPVFGGMFVNLAKGLDTIAGGDWLRGLEEMSPKVLKDLLKAGRYAQEGVKDKTGIQVLDEVGAGEMAGQALGFSPARVLEAYESRGAVYSLDRKLSKRRAELMDGYARAAMAGEDTAEALADIRAFNAANPEERINRKALVRSVRQRRLRIDRAEGGVYLPRGRQGLREEGRFFGE